MKILTFLKYLTFIVAVWFLIHSTIIIIDGLYDENKKADMAVILGNKVNTDGTLSERLKQRVDCGLELYKKGRVQKILVSGGLGKEGFYEGTQMKAYLIEKGVPDTAIAIDDFGNNTLATIENTLKLQDSLNFKTIIVVSQYFHVTRTKMLFKKHHFKDVSSVSPWYFEIRDLYSIVREFFAYYLEKINN